MKKNSNIEKKKKRESYHTKNKQSLSYTGSAKKVKISLYHDSIEGRERKTGINNNKKIWDIRRGKLVRSSRNRSY